MEEDLYVIQNLHGLIRPHLPCDQSRILTVKYSKFGTDDYGLRILKVSIELVNTTTGEDWTLEALAKVLPRDSSDLVKESFFSEIGVHTSAQNAIDLFLRKKADFFACSFGGRLNLNGSKEIDDNAVLILENCEASVCGTITGFNTSTTKIGFNLETTKIILKTLTKFHASTLALKLQNPEEFDTKIRPYLRKKNVFNEPTSEQMIEILKQKRVSTKIIERAVVAFDRKQFDVIREPWATFCHGNLSLKNILIKSNKEVKFINFQECKYDSPLTDLLYFLFSSVQLEVLRQHLDDLIEFYFENFHNNFSRQSFNEELKATASKCRLSGLNNERLYLLVKEFDKRNWL